MRDDDVAGDGGVTVSARGDSRGNLSLESWVMSGIGDLSLSLPLEEVRRMDWID